jgi:hypothetical protein
MPREIALTVIDQDGRESKVSVESRRFMIGRQSDNDLVIANGSLSRRHALIESFDDLVQISDCGSQNGTSVNGHLLTGTVELHDGDIITLGEVEVTAQIQSNGGQSSFSDMGQYPIPLHVADQDAQNTSLKATPSSGTLANGFGVHLIAGAAVVFIVAAVGLFLLISRRDQPPTSENRQSPIYQRTQSPRGLENENNEPILQASPTSTLQGSPIGPTTMPTPGPLVLETPNAGSDELDEIDKSSSAVLRAISGDTHSFLPQKTLGEINQRVKTYRGSSALQETLRNARGSIPRTVAAAKGTGLKPALVMYAAMAKMDRDNQRGDPFQSTQQMLPTLGRLREKLDNELANDCLLIVAGYDDGPALQTKIVAFSKRNLESPAEIRTVWYLHDHQALSNQAYDLVLRFLAIGVVAQNPHKFGIDADPLVFE